MRRSSKESSYNKVIHSDSPEVGDTVTEASLDIPIQSVVADIGFGALHAFDEDGAFIDVEVVVEHFAFVGSLPVELVGDLLPKAMRVIQGALVQRVVLSS